MDEILKQVRKAQNIVIVPSFRLDADCMGSALSLAKILKATVVYSGSNSGRYSFLPGADKIIFKDLFEYDFTPFDLTIFLDGPFLSQFYDFERHRGQELKLPSNLKTISIDHHEAGKNFTDITFSDPKASSTCELVYKIFVNGKKISKEIATCLFVGISGDTGHFKHSNTTPECLKIAANLLEAKVDISDIYAQLYNTQNYMAVQFSGHLISKIKLDKDYKYAYYTFSPENGFSREEMAEGSQIARDKVMLSLGGIDFCFVLKEEGNNIIKGSLRSRRQGILNLDLLAKILSPEKGGGHKESAGFTLTGMTLPEAEKYVREIIEKIMIE